MTTNEHKEPVNSQNQTVGLRAVETSGLEMTRDVENVASVGEIEDAMDDFFAPEYGGSE